MNGNSAPPWTFFCDEAGNTGPDYLASGQPFVVCAGWLVSPANLQSYRETITTRWPVSPDGSFRKTNSVLKKGESVVLDTISGLCKVATPLFVINEKRFTLLTEVFDLLCDSDWNDRASSSDAYNHVRRSEVCWRLFELLPQHMFEEFLAAYRGDVDTNRLSKLAEQLSFYLDQGGFRDDAWVILGFDAQECWREGRPSWWDISTVRTFAVLMHSTVDRIAECRGIFYNVLHHRQKQFGSILADLSENTGPAIVIPQANGKNHRVGLSRVMGFSTTPSEGKDPCEIVGADILASTLFRLARDRMTTRQRDFSARILSLVLDGTEDRAKFLMSRRVGESMMAFRHQ